MIGERAGDERSWKNTFLKKYILYRKSIYFCKKVYLRNPANTRCNTQYLLDRDFAKKNDSIFSTSICPASQKMVFGDLASKEPKDSNHARQQCTGRLGSCSAV